MGELIQGLTALCKLIHYLTEVHLKPDFFRLCKLNKASCKEVQQFMTVLHRLCCFSTTDLCKRDAHICVSSYMLKEGGAVAYCLSPAVSSRHLLLCFGWLLSHGVMETCVDKLILHSPLAEELPINKTTVANVELPMRPVVNKPEVMHNYIVLLTGLIRHNLRAISNYRQERAQLCAKVHKVTAGFKGLPHLSAGEVRLLKMPQLLPQYLASCRPCLQVLQAHSKWYKRSQLFWQWMGSTLSDEENCIAELIRKGERLYKPLSEDEVDHLKMFLKNLEESVKKSVMEEDATTNIRDITFNIDTRKMSFRGGKVNSQYMKVLDEEIETLTFLYERKKQELQKKLSKLPDISVKSGMDHINSVLNQLNIDIRQKDHENTAWESVKKNSDSLPNQSNTLSSHKSSQKCVVNKLLLE